MKLFWTKVCCFFHRIFAAVVHGVLHAAVLLAFRPKVYYESDLAKEEAFREASVLVCNHVWTLDFAAIRIALSPTPIAAVIAQDMVDKYASLRWLLKYYDHIAINRSATTMDLTWLRESRACLKDGKSIFVCPEGQTNRKFGKVTQPFHASFLAVPAMTGALVVPVYHNGEYNWFHGKRFRMMVGEPIRLTPPPAGLTPQELDREAKQLFEKVCELEEKLTGSVKKA